MEGNRLLLRSLVLLLFFLTRQGVGGGGGFQTSVVVELHGLIRVICVGIGEEGLHRNGGDAVAVRRLQKCEPEVTFLAGGEFFVT